MKADHVRLDPSTQMMFCQHCQRQQHLPLPMNLTLAADFMKSFVKIHRHCKPLGAINAG